MNYTIVRKLWNGCSERWDGLTLEQADAIYEQCSAKLDTFATSLIEEELT